MMRRILIVAVAIAILAAGVVWLRGSEWWRVDRCLDAGGRWNDETEICEGAGSSAPS